MNNETIQLLEQNLVIRHYEQAHEELLRLVATECTLALRLLMEAQGIVLDGKQVVFKPSWSFTDRVELSTTLSQPEGPSTMLRFYWYARRPWEFLATYYTIGSGRRIKTSRANNLVALMKLVKKTMKKISKNSDPYTSTAL